LYLAHFLKVSVDVLSMVRVLVPWVQDRLDWGWSLRLVHAVYTQELAAHGKPASVEYPEWAKQYKQAAKLALQCEVSPRMRPEERAIFKLYPVGTPVPGFHRPVEAPKMTWALFLALMSENGKLQVGGTTEALYRSMSDIPFEYRTRLQKRHNMEESIELHPAKEAMAEDTQKAAEKLKASEDLYKLVFSPSEFPAGHLFTPPSVPPPPVAPAVLQPTLPIELPKEHPAPVSEVLQKTPVIVLSDDDRRAVEIPEPVSAPKPSVKIKAETKEISVTAPSDFEVLKKLIESWYAEKKTLEDNAAQALDKAMYCARQIALCQACLDKARYAECVENGKKAGLL